MGLAVLPVLLVGLGYTIMRSPYVTGQNVTREQPVPFSHEHHVGRLGIDCRYCHTSVETARFAGIPPTETCMTCHSQIWTNAGMLAPVRASLAENRPLRWRRVHNLPDYVYFDHCVHVDEGRRLRDLPRARGPDAADAAGRAAHDGLVPRLPPQPRRRTCARARRCSTWPGRRRRTRPSEGRRLRGAYHIDTKHLTDCSICHR